MQCIETELAVVSLLKEEVLHNERLPWWFLRGKHLLLLRQQAGYCQQRSTERRRRSTPRRASCCYIPETELLGVGKTSSVLSSLVPRSGCGYLCVKSETKPNAWW